MDVTTGIVVSLELGCVSGMAADTILSKLINCIPYKECGMYDFVTERSMGDLVVTNWHDKPAPDPGCPMEMRTVEQCITEILRGILESNLDIGMETLSHGRIVAPCGSQIKLIPSIQYMQEGAASDFHSVTTVYALGVGGVDIELSGDTRVTKKWPLRRGDSVRSIR